MLPSKGRAGSSNGGGVSWGAAPFPQHNIPMPGLETPAQVHMWEEGKVMLRLMMKSHLQGEPPLQHSPPCPATRCTHGAKHQTSKPPHSTDRADHTGRYAHFWVIKALRGIQEMPALSHIPCTIPHPGGRGSRCAAPSIPHSLPLPRAEQRASWRPPSKCCGAD